jgi:hypothetical protein
MSRTHGTTLSLALLTVSTFLAPVIGRSMYWVNDDVGHLLWFSGGYSGSPEFQNPVLGMPFGLLITMLYQLASGIPWYPILVLAIPLAACGLLLWHVQGLLTTPQYVPIVVVMCNSLLLLGVCINYTYASFVASGALAALYGFQSREMTLSRKTLVVSIVLGILALSLRSNWLFYGLGFPMPFLFATLCAVVFFLPRTGQHAGRFIGRFTVIVGVVYLLAALPQYVVMQKDSEWRAFQNFYLARGEVNGVKIVGDYLSSEPAQTVFRQTGMDSTDIFQLESWALFDATDVSPDNLRALREAAESSSQTGDGILDQALQLISNVVKWLFTPEIALLGGMLFVGLVLGTARSSVSPWVLLRAFPAYVVAGGLFVFATSGVRSPDYVVLGSHTVLAMIGLVAIPRNSGMPSARKGTALFVLVGLSVILGHLLWGTEILKQVAIIPEAKSLGELSRAELTRSQSSSIPIVHDVMLVGYAYQAAPFDSSVPQHYLLSKNFVGGAKVRAPQYVRRWNLITQSKETSESLFDENFFTRVAVSEGFASAFRSQFANRGACFAQHQIGISGYVRLKKSTCNKITALESGWQDFPSFWWSREEGSVFVATTDLLYSLDVHLLSPFGEFAQPHGAELLIVDSENIEKWRQRVVVVPGRGNRVEVPRMFAGQRLVIRSLDSCVVPFEVNPIRFPDRRKLCVGIGELSLGGESISLKSTIP